jgi:hypothetical protein
MRNLDQQTRAIPGLGIAPTRSAVNQVLQNLQPLQDDLMRGLAIDVNDKPESARVVFIPWIVKTLRGGQLVGSIDWVHLASSTSEG